MSLCATGVNSWLAISRFAKREVSRHMWSLTATATTDAMVSFATLRWDLSVVYGRPAAYHRAMGPLWG